MSGAALPSDDHTVKLGLLMEAAHSHQELVDGSLRQLQAHTRGLDDVVRDEIRRVMSAELTELMDEAARAAGLEVAAVVLTPWPAPGSELERSNRETIADLGRVDVEVLEPIGGARLSELARAGAGLPWQKWIGRQSVP